MELNEVSKQLLGRYINKATMDFAGKRDRTTYAMQKHYGTNPKHPEIESSVKAAAKRKAGIEKAVNRLTKEDINLDEGRALGRGMSPEARARDIEQSDREYIEQRQRKEEWKRKNPGKPFPGHAAIKEPLEQLDELSAMTTHRYIKKAGQYRDFHKREADAAAKYVKHARAAGNTDVEKEFSQEKETQSRLANKREKGINRAIKSLAKNKPVMRIREETDPNAKSNKADYPDLRDYEYTKKEPTRLKDFLKLHRIKKHQDRNGNGDEVFKASNVETDERAPHHGYDQPKDAKEYM